MATQKNEWSEASITELLASSYAATNGWRAFPQLRSATGYARGLRIIDLFCLGTWPSTGFKRIAYEIKVSRGDLLAELADPSKRKDWMEVTNEFWYAVPEGLCQPDEVPENCGLVTVHRGGYKTKKQAAFREVPPLPIEVVASIVLHEFQQPQPSRPWLKFMGREITEEDIEKHIGKLLEKAKQELEMQMKYGMVEGGDLKKSRALAQFLAEMLGLYSYTATVEEAKRELARRPPTTLPPVVWSVLSGIESSVTRLTMLLKEASGVSEQAVVPGGVQVDGAAGSGGDRGSGENVLPVVLQDEGGNGGEAGPPPDRAGS